MVKLNEYGEYAWKIKALNCAIVLAILVVIGAVPYFGYKIVQPITSQAAMASAEEETKSTRILMSVAARGGLNVRKKPSTEGDIVLVLKNGEKVEVLSTASDEWVYIRCIERNDEEGYASSKYLVPMEKNGIGTEADEGIFTDNLKSEEDVKKEEAKNKAEHGGIKYWLMKHVGKLMIGGVIVEVLVCWLVFRSRSSSGSKTYSSGNTYSSGGYQSSLDSPKPERTFTQGGATGCGIGGSFCGMGSGI